MLSQKFIMARLNKVGPPTFSTRLSWKLDIVVLLNEEFCVDIDCEGFELCPADACAIGDSYCPIEGADSGAEKGSQADAGQQVPANKFTITHDYDDHPIIAKLQQCLVDNGIEVAGIEIIADAEGEVYAYDINTNTNYNAQAEAEANVETTGMGAVAKFLTSLA